MKTPQLRSIEALDRSRECAQAAWQNVCKCMWPPPSAREQEYFLIDKDAYAQRPDLFFAGRTLSGARLSPIGQEMEDQYFASIRTRVKAFMRTQRGDLEAWRFLRRTEHNEVAPAQHELAPIYSTTNVQPTTTS
jgi:glutamine synthetase